MTNAEKIAITATSGLALGIALAVLIISTVKDIKMSHKQEVQRAYEEGYSKGVEDGKAAVITELQNYKIHYE